jgi:hypothetical protein
MILVPEDELARCDAGIVHPSDLWLRDAIVEAEGLRSRVRSIATLQAAAQFGNTVARFENRALRGAQFIEPRFVRRKEEQHGMDGFGVPTAKFPTLGRALTGIAQDPRTLRRCDAVLEFGRECGQHAHG